MMIREFDETLDLNGSLDTGHGTDSRITPQDVIDTQEYLRGVRKQQNDGLPYEQKLELVMQRLEDVERLARLAAQQVVGTQHMIERRFNDIHTSLQRLASGQSPHAEPEPGTSIFDESLMY